MNDRYDAVFVLNYYAPYVSGLTDAARLVAEELAASGKRIAVVAGQHDRALPRQEVIAGVEVVRTPVLFRVGKGLVSPSFIPTAVDLGSRADVVNLHLPMIEAGPIARSLFTRTRVVTTYHCDIALPGLWIDRIQTAVMDASVSMAFRNSHVVVPSSADYAEHSRVRSSMPTDGTVPIAPPTRARVGGSPRFRDGDGLHVGFLGRLVEEKGLEYLIDGFRAIDDDDARLLIGGGFNAAGGSVIDKVREHMGDDPRVRLLGFLPENQLADFYASIDVFALPSVNSFEAFGIVQVEAMRSGVAALASDLPGVRTPVEATGFGVIVPPRDSAAITRALLELRDTPRDPVKGAASANSLYSLEMTVDEYRQVFSQGG